MISNLNIDIDYNKLKKEYFNLGIDNLIKNNNDLKQLSLQCRQNTDINNQLSESCGSLLFDWTKYEKNLNEKLPLRKTILKEKDFNYTCNFFQNTIFEDVITSLQENNYDVVRGRFMLLQHKTCLTYHRDSSPRIHIPIYTNENCMMIINDKVYRMQFGRTYLVDTTEKHTALNASKDSRVHLVFSLSA
jgi:hypothetical protein